MENSENINNDISNLSGKVTNLNGSEVVLHSVAKHKKRTFIA